jgi:hypothetical protein
MIKLLAAAVLALSVTVVLALTVSYYLMIMMIDTTT